MDVLNKLSPKRFYEIDSFLAFLSIYEDKARERAYLGLLRAHRDAIRGAVCVEAGSGLGVMSAEMAKLGAKKVYAVEVNPELYELSRSRLAGFPNVEVVKADIRDFEPREGIDVLVHEFYGQLLYDEDLYLLGELAFEPRLVLPDSGTLLCGTASVSEWDDDILDGEAIKRFDSVIVSGLFDEEGTRPGIEVLNWSAREGIDAEKRVSLKGRKGDLLYFGMEVRHAGKLVCRSGVCDNWSLGWTWRKGDEFSFGFNEAGGSRSAPRAPEAIFRWR
jgi:SAM-dependent methyltransferase